MRDNKPRDLKEQDKKRSLHIGVEGSEFVGVEMILRDGEWWNLLKFKTKRPLTPKSSP